MRSAKLTVVAEMPQLRVSAFRVEMTKDQQTIPAFRESCAGGKG